MGRISNRILVTMCYRIADSKFFGICVFITFIMGCYLASIPIPTDKRALPSPGKFQKSYELATKKHLAIIVPFRDRFVELLSFVPHMYDFLNRQGVPFHIFVVQQVDNNRFNRASLINTGFLYTKKDFHYIAMHDVDLLPLNNHLSYDYPAHGPHHISSPSLHPNYHYNTFIGGILLVTREQFERVNGMSNKYWGWGLEDDELYTRFKDAGLQITRPENIKTGTQDTFLHNHDKTLHRRDYRKCYNQREVTRRRDRVTGLHDLQYKIVSVHNITIDTLPITILNVELQCDQTQTPWCQCPDPPKAKKPKVD